MPFFRTEDLTETTVLPGVTRRAVWLDGVMVTFFEFEPNAVVPEHSHPHEQISVVIEGGMLFELDGETRVLHAGDGACIPPNVPHSARALGVRTVAHDSWNPPREDYRDEPDRS